jgi:DNA-binding FrmR family transcriptional regulator
MGLCGSDQDKERLVKRLHRIEGQVRGLCGMVEKDSDCMDVLRQIASVSGALRGVWTQVVEDHIHGCIARAALDTEASNKLVKELVEHISKIR